MKTFIALVFGFILTQTVVAQSPSPQEALTALQENYASAGSYAMDFQVQAFRQSDNQVLTNEKGMVAVSGSQRLTSFMGLTTLINKRCQLAVHERSRQIIFTRTEMAGFSTEQGFDLDSVLTTYQGAEVTMKWLNTGRQRVLEINPEAQEYEKVLLTIDVDKSELKALEYHYQNVPPQGVSRVLVSYQNVEVGKEVPKSHFDEKKFVRKSGNRLIPQGAYAQYKVVDQQALATLPE